MTSYEKQKIILDFCNQMNRPVTAMEVIRTKFPKKQQPYINSEINTLVSQCKLIRNDEGKSYTVRVPKEGEEIPPPKDYSRDRNKSALQYFERELLTYTSDTLLSFTPKSESNNSILNILYSFFNEIGNRKIEIYNEFSFQHELGIYLRETMPKHKVQFERNVSYFFRDRVNTIKKEIDISVFTPDYSEKYAIELKAPQNGRHPESM